MVLAIFASNPGMSYWILPATESTLDMPSITYLDRLLDPVVESFTPAVARKIISLRADPELEQRISELRRKANEGALTPDEDAEYKDFVESVDVISILQAKASRFLLHHPG